MMGAKIELQVTYSDTHNDVCKEKESDPSKKSLRDLPKALYYICPQNFCPCCSPRQKMGMNSFENKSFMSQWEGSACTHERSNFFSFRDGGKQGFFCFSLFPNVFPSCSQWVLKFSKGSQVSKCIPQDIPNSTWVLSHMVSQSSTPLYIN